MQKVKVYYWIPALAIALALIAGCQKQDPATVVKQRATERWNLLIGSQPVKAYEYLSPGYRTTHTLDQYVAFVATARLRWKGARVAQEQCSTDVCTLHLIIESTVPATVANTPRDLQLETPITEQWIASGGQWYFLPETGVAPRAAGKGLQEGFKPAGAVPQAPTPSASRPPAPEPARPPPSGTGK